MAASSSDSDPGSGTTGSPVNETDQDTLMDYQSTNDQQTDNEKRTGGYIRMILYPCNSCGFAAKNVADIQRHFALCKPQGNVIQPDSDVSSETIPENNVVHMNLGVPVLNENFVEQNENTNEGQDEAVSIPDQEEANDDVMECDENENSSDLAPADADYQSYSLSDENGNCLVIQTYPNIDGNPDIRNGIYYVEEKDLVINVINGDVRTVYITDILNDVRNLTVADYNAIRDQLMNSDGNDRPASDNPRDGQILGSNDLPRENAIEAINNNLNIQNCDYLNISFAGGQAAEVVGAVNPLVQLQDIDSCSPLDGQMLETGSNQSVQFSFDATEQYRWEADFNLSKVIHSIRKEIVTDEDHGGETNSEDAPCEQQCPDATSDNGTERFNHRLDVGDQQGTSRCNQESASDSATINGLFDRTPDVHLNDYDLKFMDEDHTAAMDQKSSTTASCPNYSDDGETNSCTQHMPESEQFSNTFRKCSEDRDPCHDEPGIADPINPLKEDDHQQRNDSIDSVTDTGNLMENGQNILPCALPNVEMEKLQLNANPSLTQSQNPNPMQNDAEMCSDNVDNEFTFWMDFDELTASTEHYWDEIDVQEQIEVESTEEVQSQKMDD